MNNKLIAILNLTYSVAIGILGYDHQEDRVKFCWIRDGEQEQSRFAMLRGDKHGRIYFESHRQKFYIDEFIKLSRKTPAFGHGNIRHKQKGGGVHGV